jgi:hypothetical protein
MVAEFGTSGECKTTMVLSEPTTISVAALKIRASIDWNGHANDLSSSKSGLLMGPSREAFSKILFWLVTSYLRQGVCGVAACTTGMPRYCSAVVTTALPIGYFNCFSVPLSRIFSFSSDRNAIQFFAVEGMTYYALRFRQNIFIRIAWESFPRYPAFLYLRLT